MKIIVFSMITFFTSVVMLSTTASAQNTNIVSGDAEKQRSKDCKRPEFRGNLTEFECRMRLNSGGGAGFEDECKAAEKALAEPLKAFNKACGVFKLKGVSCAEKIHSCPGDEEEEDDTEDKKGKSVDKSKYSVCPIPALKDAKLAKEKIKELKSEIDDVEDRVDSSKEKLEEAKKNLETAQAERVEAYNEREAQNEKDMKEQNLVYEEKTKDMQSQIEKSGDQIEELRRAGEDLAPKYAEDLAKIEAICEAVAEKALSDKITAEVNNVKNNQQKQRNLQAQLTLKSKGRTAENEAFRQREIARCRQHDKKWKDPVTKLNENYALMRKRVEEAILKVLQKQQKLQVELNQTLPQKQQKEAAELTARYEKDKAAIASKFEAKIGQCGNFQAMQQNGQPNQTTTPNGCTGLSGSVALATANLANLEEKLSDKKSDLEYYTELLAAASSVVSDTEAEGVELMSAAEDYRQALIVVGSSCSGKIAPAKAKEYVSILNGMDTGSSTTKGTSADSIILQSTTEVAEGLTGRGSGATEATSLPAGSSSQTAK